MKIAKIEESLYVRKNTDKIINILYFIIILIFVVFIAVVVGVFVELKDSLKK